MDNLSATSSNRSFMDLEVSAYSTDDLTALVKVWAAQPWPISREKALSLCSQCDWVVMLGQDEVFGTPLPYGSTDYGTIRFDSLNPTIISGVDVELTPRVPDELISSTTPVVNRIYTDYLNAISKLHGKPDTFNNEAGQCCTWTLPHHASLALILNQTYLKMRIHSPEQTERILQAIHCLADHRRN